MRKRKGEYFEDDQEDEKKARTIVTLDRSWETKLHDRGYKYIAGVDEAGRGPLAGPVVAAACMIPLDIHIEGVNDSKEVEEEDRESIFNLLTTNDRIIYSVSVVDHKRIDEINIREATREAMAQAVATLRTPPDYVLVDGNMLPPLSPALKAEAVIQGDSKVFCIAAASILAKVTRDKIMKEYEAEFPGYSFAQHKGYGTRDHMAAIARLGPCRIHRYSFAPMKYGPNGINPSGKGPKPKPKKKKTLKEHKTTRVPERPATASGALKTSRKEEKKEEKKKISTTGSASKRTMVSVPKRCGVMKHASRTTKRKPPTPSPTTVTSGLV